MSAILCPACGSESWTRVQLRHVRHELSLRADPAAPLKDDTDAHDEATIEDRGWCCGVCRRAAGDLGPVLEELAARARDVGAVS